MKRVWQLILLEEPMDLDEPGVLVLTGGKKSVSCMMVERITFKSTDHDEEGDLAQVKYCCSRE